MNKDDHNAYMSEIKDSETFRSSKSSMYVNQLESIQKVLLAGQQKWDRMI